MVKSKKSSTEETLALARIGPVETRVSTTYEYHERATETYKQWMSGFIQEEIAKFFAVEVTDIENDIQHIQSELPVRLVTQHYNDRNRIILQREQSDDFRNLIKSALSIPASEYLISGVSPASVMKEYREAVGMTQRPEPLVQVNQQSNTYINNQPSHGITSSEDVIRRVLDKINEEDGPIIDAELSSDSPAPGNETVYPGDEDIPVEDER